MIHHTCTRKTEEKEEKKKTKKNLKVLTQAVEERKLSTVKNRMHISQPQEPWANGRAGPVTHSENEVLRQTGIKVQP